MDVQLTAEESGALQRALRTYCSDLRMEIIATDNPAYRRELREDRAVLESVIGKLDAVASPPAAAPEGDPDVVVVRLVSVWET